MGGRTGVGGRGLAAGLNSEETAARGGGAELALRASAALDRKNSPTVSVPAASNTAKTAALITAMARPDNLPFCAAGNDGGITGGLPGSGTTLASDVGSDGPCWPLGSVWNTANK